MPTTTFSRDQVRVSPTSFPKVKLAKDEKVRLVCIERSPVYEWVHDLKRPVVSKITGRPVMEKKKRQNDEEYETYKLDFVGRPICHGDPDILDDQGIDPKHCPACKLAKETDFVSAPVRRYAIHVEQYATKDGSTLILEPFSVSTKVWVLTERNYAKVVELMEEANVDDPRKIDILLTQKGPETFGQYEMQLGRNCEMIASKERMERAIATYQANHAPDLSPYCGKAVKLAYLREDCDSVVSAWEIVRSSEAGAAAQSSLDARPIPEMDMSLLDQVGSGQQAVPAQAQAAAPVAQQAPAATEAVQAAAADLAGLDVAVPAQAPAPAQQAATPATADQGAVANFDDLLASLG